MIEQETAGFRFQQATSSGYARRPALPPEEERPDELSLQESLDRLLWATLSENMALCEKNHSAALCAAATVTRGVTKATQARSDGDHQRRGPAVAAAAVHVGFGVAAGGSGGGLASPEAD